MKAPADFPLNANNGDISDYTTLPAGWKYEVAVATIEMLIARIESGELELAEVFEQFEQAVSHLQECEAFLSQHQQQMDLMIETLRDDSGF
jgi:exodeoxyribonuclease VII small subunit